MLDRQLGIVYELMNKKTVTAAELARQYEVSTRTIYRDVETISMAGIPIYASKGKNGGISLTDSFVLNKLLVTQTEQQEILTALTSLEELGALNAENTINKLRALFQTDAQNWVSIDFSDWGGVRQKLFEDIKFAILHRKVITFDYAGRNKELGNREVEPIQVVFKEYTWYLKAYCHKREDIRIFKLQRMSHLCITEQDFSVNPSKYARQDEETDQYVHGSVPAEAQVNSLTKITLQIKPAELYRVYDLLAGQEPILREDGDYEVTVDCIVDDWILGIILSFGANAKVLSPDIVKDEIKSRIDNMRQVYI